MSGLRGAARAAALLSLVFVLTSCGVRRDLHQAALDTIAEDASRLDSARAELAACTEARDRQATELGGALEQCRAELEVVAAARDEVLADNATLRAKLKTLGSDMGDLLDARSEMARLLDEANRALTAARERDQKAAERDRIYRQVKDRLQKVIDSGKVSVRVARGRLVIDLKQDILFPSGSADLSDIGIETLGEVSAALRDVPGRSFQVEGHTDNVPIKTTRFPSNWELSTARAVSVVKLFVDKGMAPERLSAAGFGAFQPRADNGSEEGRALNRRIEIVMVPDLQALPDLVEAL